MNDNNNKNATDATNTSATHSDNESIDSTKTLYPDSQIWHIVDEPAKAKTSIKETNQPNTTSP